MVLISIFLCCVYCKKNRDVKQEDKKIIPENIVAKDKKKVPEEIEIKD